MILSPEKLEKGEERREIIYRLNGENIEKLKKGNFSWKDYKESFEEALRWGIIEKVEDPDEILRVEEEDILRIGKGIHKKTGIEKGAYEYVGPEKEPDEIKAPERFLFDGLKSALIKAANSCELRGKKREMADYIFGDIQDRIEKGEMDWEAFGEVLEIAREYGRILKEISKKEYERIVEDQEKKRKEIWKELNSLIKREKILAQENKAKELKKIFDQEEDVREKFEMLLRPIRYVTKWEKGKPVEEKFYTFAGTFRDMKRGSFEALVYGEISGPILEAVFENSKRRKKERKKERWERKAEREIEEQKKNIFENSLSSDLERLERTSKKHPDKARKKAEKLVEKIAGLVNVKIALDYDHWKAWKEKEVEWISRNDLNEMNPSLIIDPEKIKKEEKRILEIKFDPGDIELEPPYNEGKVIFLRSIRKKNLLFRE